MKVLITWKGFKVLIFKSGWLLSIPWFFLSSPGFFGRHSRMNLSPYQPRQESCSFRIFPQGLGLQLNGLTHQQILLTQIMVYLAFFSFQLQLFTLCAFVLRYFLLKVYQLMLRHYTSTLCLKCSKALWVSLIIVHFFPTKSLFLTTKSGVTPMLFKYEFKLRINTLEQKNSRLAESQIVMTFILFPFLIPVCAHLPSLSTSQFTLIQWVFFYLLPPDPDSPFLDHVLLLSCAYLHEQHLETKEALPMIFSSGNPFPKIRSNETNQEKSYVTLTKGSIVFTPINWHGQNTV